MSIPQSERDTCRQRWPQLADQLQTLLHHVNPPPGDLANVLGFTAGIGGQFIDDFGIRAIPEVRYTRWMGYPFDSVHGKTRKNQIEIVLTFAF